MYNKREGRKTMSEKKKYRTAGTVDALANWLSEYDKIHKTGTMQAPYDLETWKRIVAEVALDFAEIKGYKKEGEQ